MVAEVFGMPTAMAIGLGANLAVGTANLGMSIKNNMDMQRMARDVLDAKRDMMQVRNNSNCNMMGYNNNNNPQMMQMMQTMNQLQQQMQMMQNQNCGNNWGNNNWNGNNNNWNNNWNNYSNNYPYGNGGNGFPY